ncbi:MAG: TlpA disulfide reductase family protein [Thermodesulfobacteriota bacterium]
MRLYPAYAFTALLILALPVAIGCSKDAGGYAPDFSVTVVGGGGDEWLDRNIKLSDMRGTPVVVHFTASWCNACRRIFGTITDDYDGVFVMGVGVLDRKSNIVEFVRAQDLPAPVGYDEDGTIAYDYNVTTLPFTVFIDSEGRVAEKVMGTVEGERLKELMLKITRT